VVADLTGARWRYRAAPVVGKSATPQEASPRWVGALGLSQPVFRLKLNAFLYVCQDEVSHIKRQIVE
jgi:hypothetical protein